MILPESTPKPHSDHCKAHMCGLRFSGSGQGHGGGQAVLMQQGLRLAFRTPMHTFIAGCDLVLGHLVHAVGRCLFVKTLGTCRSITQRSQYPLIKEYTLNHNIKPPII